MPQIPIKNRRCRDTKISEYKFKKLVKAFAYNKTAIEASKESKLSEPTVRHRFMQLRQLLFDHGPMRIDINNVEGRPAKDRPAKYIFDRQYRGVKEKYAHLYEIEVLNRIFVTKNIRAVKRFSASNERHMEKVKKYIDYNKLHDKYDIIEVLYDGTGKSMGKRDQRPFDLLDYRENSHIIVNEYNLSPEDAFFYVLWALLLKHPL